VVSATRSRPAIVWPVDWWVVTRIDWTVVRTAATGGLIVIVPGALLSGMLADRWAGWPLWVFLAVVLGGFGVAGFVAGRLRRDTPILHGALASVAACAVALAIGLVLASSRGQGIGWAAAPVTAVLAVTAGVAGSLLGDRLYRGRAGSVHRAG
jgi:hypothetical protein